MWAGFARKKKTVKGLILFLEPACGGGEEGELPLSCEGLGPSFHSGGAPQGHLGELLVGRMLLQHRGSTCWIQLFLSIPRELCPMLCPCHWGPPRNRLPCPWGIKGKQQECGWACL